MVKNPPANAGDTRNLGSIPGLGKSHGEGVATTQWILAWGIPWTEEPGRLQSRVSQSQTQLRTHATPCKVCLTQRRDPSGRIWGNLQDLESE